MIDDDTTRELLKEMSADGVNPPVIEFLLNNFNEMQGHFTFLKHIYRLTDIDHDKVSKDAWSHGQLNSKIWLLKELSKIDLDLGDIWLLCGWVGSLSLLMNHVRLPLSFSTIRSFDIDSRCAQLADILNKPQVKNNWRFKATTADVNKLRYNDHVYETIKYDGSKQTLIESADTIINTSCDHMGEDSAWWDNITPGKLIILQNNDFVDIDEHNNTVDSICKFRDMYPMENLLYSGTLDCKIYNRFMLIGYK
jgi:hypothetical protein